MAKVWILFKFGFRNKSKISDFIRRSRATSLYRDGVPLEQVSALIGHSQIETTRSYYASPSPEQMKAAVEKGSNREPDQLPEWLGHTDDLKKKLGLA